MHPKHRACPTASLYLKQHGAGVLRSRRGGEARKAQALTRIWHRLNEPDSSGHQQPEASASPVRHPCADHAGGIRLLVEEMQKDPEVADALRADLAASLREVAKAHVQRTLSEHDLDDAQQQRLFGTDQHNEALSRASHTLQVRDAVHSLQAGQSDITSRLQDVDELLRTLQLSQLKAAVVRCVTSPEESARRGDIVRNSVDVADSLEKLREATRELSRSAEMFRVATREVTGRAEVARELSRSAEMFRVATRELSHCTEKLRTQVQRIIEDHISSDRDESNSGFFLNLGEMLYLGPRLQHSEFDPGLQNAFGSAGDLLTRSSRCLQDLKGH